MSDSRDVGYAIFGLGFGVWYFFHGLGVLRKKRFIESIPTSTVRGLAIGLVELNGKAKKTKELQSPLTGTECTFYRYTIERYESSGRSSRWVLINQNDSAACPFYLDDNTGQIMVLPQGAEYVMPVNYTFTTGLGSGLPDNLIHFMEENGIAYKGLFGNYKLRFNEWHIKPDDTVFVVGTAQRNETDVIVAKSDDGQVFIVSDESPTQVVKSFSWRAWGGIWGGSVLSLVLLAYLLFRLGLWARF